MAVLELLHGDCRTVMAGLPAASVDAVVCDPPYGLSFMGKGWDHGVPGAEFWAAALRVAKPGAHLLAFGGTRTFHRMAVAIEDAGWEIRDTVMWVYGSGFPKSHNVGKGIDKAAGAEREVVGNRMADDIRGGNMHAANRGERHFIDITAPATDAAKHWEGWGTALKPAWEPIIVARKPLEGTVAANVLAHGTGALNIDGCRVAGTPEATRFDPARHSHEGWRMNATGAEIAAKGTQGRWPANLIHDGSDEVVALFPVDKPHKMVRNRTLGARPFNNDGKATEYETTETIEDSGGSAARFFYCAKANKSDRNEGLDALERKAKVFNGKTASPSPSNSVEGSVNEKFSTHPQQNHHPTVKPTELMRYLVRLCTQAQGIVLDPFCGSGSTGKAAILEGFRFIGIEKDPEYCEIANLRIAASFSKSRDGGQPDHNELKTHVSQQSMFGA